MWKFILPKVETELCSWSYKIDSISCLTLVTAAIFLQFNLPHCLKIKCQNVCKTIRAWNGSFKCLHAKNYCSYYTEFDLNSDFVLNQIILFFFRCSDNVNFILQWQVCNLSQAPFHWPGNQLLSWSLSPNFGLKLPFSWGKNRHTCTLTFALSLCKRPREF